MNFNSFSAPDFSPPKPPKFPTPASKLIEEMKFQMAYLESTKPTDQVLRICYGGAFGVIRTGHIASIGQDLLRMVVKHEDGTFSSIFAPVSQCSFMFSLVPKTQDEPGDEKIVLLFKEEGSPQDKKST
jgi:hypothetical protein